MSHRAEEKRVFRELGGRDSPGEREDVTPEWGKETKDRGKRSGGEGETLHLMNIEELLSFVGETEAFSRTFPRLLEGTGPPVWKRKKKKQAKFPAKGR